MASSSTSLAKRLENVSTQQISLVSLTALLAVSGVAIFLWMAVTGWADITGIIVGVIFIVLTVLQVVFAVVWWKSQNRTAQKYAIQQEAPINCEKVELVNSATGDNGTVANRQLVTDEVKLCYTDGAQKMDVEVVAV